jgi:hypothetical protein
MSQTTTQTDQQNQSTDQNIDTTATTDTERKKPEFITEGSLIEKLRKNGILSLYNVHKSEGTMSTFLAFEPYVWLILGLIITVFIVVNGLYSGSNISLRLSVLWIVLGILSLLGTVTGAYRYESHFSE